MMKEERDLDQVLEALLQALTKTDAYNHYMASRRSLMGRPELKEQVDDLRRRVFYLHNNGENSDIYEENDRIAKEYQSILRLPEVIEFLEAEAGLARMIQTLNRKVSRQLDVQLPWQEDSHGW